LGLSEERRWWEWGRGGTGKVVGEFKSARGEGKGQRLVYPWRR